MIKGLYLIGVLLTGLLTAGCTGGGSGSAVTHSPLPDATPTVLAVEFIGRDRFGITFTTPNPACITYEIQYRVGNAPYVHLQANTFEGLKQVQQEVSLPVHVSETEQVTFRVGASLNGTSSSFSNEFSILPLSPAWFTNPLEASWEAVAAMGPIRLDWNQYSRFAKETIIEIATVDEAGNIGAWVPLAKVPPTTMTFSFDRSNGLKELTSYEFRIYNRADTASSYKCYSRTKRSDLFRALDVKAIAEDAGTKLTWKNESLSAADIVVWRSANINEPTDEWMNYWEPIATLPSGTSDFFHQLPSTLINPFNSYSIEVRSPKRQLGRFECLSDAARVCRPLPSGPLKLHANLVEMPKATMPPVLDHLCRWYTCWNFNNEGRIGIPTESSWEIFHIPPTIARPGVMLDKDGGVNIIYTNRGDNPEMSELYHARYIQGSWKTTIIARQVFTPEDKMEISAILDPSGHIHIAWLNGSLFTYVTNRTGIWSSEPIQTPTSLRGAWLNLGLAFDSEESVFIVRARYDMDFNIPSGFDLIRRSQTGKWTTSNVPFVSNACLENRVQMLHSGNRSIFVHFFRHQETEWSLLEDIIEIMELTPQGWSIPKRAPIPTRSAYTFYDTAISEDGCRLAILYQGLHEYVLAVRENDAWQSNSLHTTYSNVDSVGAVAFTPSGKLRLNQDTPSTSDEVSSIHVLTEEE